MTASKIVAAAASGAGSDPLDVDDVFKPFVYYGNNGSVSYPRTITNNIDLSGKGGLVWTKSRSGASSHELFDTERGVNKALRTNESSAQGTTSSSAGFSSFNSDGYSLAGQYGTWGSLNTNNHDHVSWTFRKAEKFFDIVTYTGNATSGRQIAHNLGSVPGMIIVKKLSSNGSWRVYHRGIGGGSSPEGKYMDLQSTDGYSSLASVWNNTAPTATHFTLGDQIHVNENGETFVAYLFAHNTGNGTFGPDEDQDIIKCGYYTGDSASQQVSLGFEPQWIMVKNSSRASTPWGIFDTTRYWQNPAAGGDSKYLNPNDVAVESGIARFYPTATGFGFTTENGTHVNNQNDVYIYCAIRKGSLFPPENASDVFDIATATGASGELAKFRTTFRVDFALDRANRDTSGYFRSSSRLTGTRRLTTSANDTEQNQSTYEFDYMTGWHSDSGGDGNYFTWMWQRAPKFCDVVCWKGNGSAQNIAHNLEVTPEMIWIKARNLAENWCVFHKDISPSKFLRLNSSNEEISDTSATRFAGAYPNSSTFPISSDNEVNGSGYYYVAYLFATLAGISKVGSFVADGNAQNINCGFSNGARFVLIKKTSSPFNWRVWDSQRGIVAGDDPYLHLNDSDAEQTNGDWVDPHSSGFSITSAFSNGTYAFYAIA